MPTESAWSLNATPRRQASRPSSRCISGSYGWVIPVRIRSRGRSLGKSPCQPSGDLLSSAANSQGTCADDRLPWFRRNVRPLCELRRLSFRWLRWSACMQRIDWIAVRLAALSAVSFAIGACSSDLSSTVLRTPDWASFSGAKNEFALRRVTSEDVVGAEGQCPVAGPSKPPALRMRPPAPRQRRRWFQAGSRCR